MVKQIDLANDIKRRFRDTVKDTLKKSNEFKSVQLDKSGQYIIAKTYDDAYYKMHLSVRFFDTEYIESEDIENADETSA